MNTRIVVAEDERHIRRLIGLTLRAQGYSVLEAATGSEALELTRDHQPDLVILDVRLPEVSGLEVARTLAAEQPTAAIPIMMISAGAQSAEIKAGLASGARAYLAKPFDLRELEEQVAQVLQQGRPLASGLTRD